jgi:phosphoglycolate phosphatase-like HAD superfamily hydrolase
MSEASLPQSPLIGPASRVALFDFDGTLSLIRTGWQSIMIPMMVEVLFECGTGEDIEQVRSAVREKVFQLTGKDTIYQMEELHQQVLARGGEPLPPLTYKSEYLRRLRHAIADRVEGLRRGTIDPDALLVPGARAFLEALQKQELRLYLASGTDHADVLEEARLLRIDGFFGDSIFGARDDYSFSKALLVRRILASSERAPAKLIGFGDGFVEIEEVKKAGGVAVGIATFEPECIEIDAWKQRRLTLAGADYILPNFLCQPLLLSIVSESRA